jgi:hypothetical protein
VHSQLPHHFYVYVDNAYIGPEMPKGFTKGILHGFYGRDAQMMMCHVLLETGAHWSGMPLSAVYHKEVNNSIDFLQPWGCMGKEMQITFFDYLEGLTGKTLKENLKFRHTGIIVDWKDGFSRYPSEHKPLSLLALEQGNFALLPNNYFRLFDKHFTEPLEQSNVNLKKYKRGETVYWE